jgi:hypothetical protein
MHITLQTVRYRDIKPMARSHELISRFSLGIARFCVASVGISELPSTLSQAICKEFCLSTRITADSYSVLPGNSFPGCS